METFLLALVAAAIKGGAAGAATYVTGLSLDEWLTFGASLAAAVEPELAGKLGLHEQSPAAFVEALLKGMADELLNNSAQRWLSANADAAMRLRPGMGPH